MRRILKSAGDLLLSRTACHLFRNGRFRPDFAFNSRGKRGSGTSSGASSKRGASSRKCPGSPCPRGATARHASNPALLSDVFVRVGGAGVGKAVVSLEINSNDVIGDHLWLWRADHGKGTGWTSNTADSE